MPGPTNGLATDLALIRRRGWLFAPFFLLGLLVAFALGSLAGDANAVATLSLDTVVHDAVIGGDRGLRIFEAQSMTFDEAFAEKVRAKSGATQLDYGRFTVSLSPISIADGVSRGTLTVSITDPDQANAKLLRQAWVDAFVEEYTDLDGLFRQRFIAKKREVAAQAEADYSRLLADLRAAAPGAPIEAFVEQPGPGSYVAALNAEDARVRAELAEVRASLAAPGGGDVSELRRREAVLATTIESLSAARAAAAGTSLEPGIAALAGAARGARIVRDESYTRLANALVAIRSAESEVEVTYSLSGGFAGSLAGRIGVTLAVTVVFGLIAIYTLEWLAQVRRGGTGGPA